jgi:anti-sigma-K factor RskA
MGVMAGGTGVMAEQLADERRQTWNNFLRFIWGSAAITAVVLVFIALVLASRQFLG